MPNAKPAIPAELVLDTSKLESWEIAARLHMLVAYPDQTPDRRERLVNAACADQIRVLMEERPERRDELLASYPQYNPFTDRTGRNAIVVNLEDAQRMGGAVLVLIKMTATGELPVFNGEQGALSLDFIAPKLWPRLAREDEEKYLQRVHSLEEREIRSRYPVAHLAAAFAWIAKEMSAAGSEMLYSYLDLDFHRRWVAKANEIAGYIRKTPGLENMAAKLIEIRWIEPAQVSAPQHDR